jgi:hypothetical protein
MLRAAATGKRCRGRGVASDARFNGRGWRGHAAEDDGDQELETVGPTMEKGSMLRAAATLALLLAFAACAPARVAPEGATIAAAADEDRELVVRITNDLIPPTVLTVWLVPEAGARRMLGTVTPQDTISFPIDAFAAGRHRLLARTTAGAEITSELFTPPVPGVIRWNVRMNLVAKTALDEKRNPADDPER